MTSLAEKLAAMSEERRLYLLQTLPAHLVAGGVAERAKTLLLDFDFLITKLSSIGIEMLLEDCDLLDFDSNIQLIKSALNLSSHTLDEINSQFTSQFYARLHPHLVESNAFNDLLVQIATSEIYPALLPINDQMIQAGFSLIRIFRTGNIISTGAIAYNRDASKIVCGSGLVNPMVVTVWDVVTGQKLWESERLKASVQCVAFGSDGDTVIAGCRGMSKRDDKWYVWDIYNNTSTIKTGQLYHIALSEDGKMLALASSDTIGIYDSVSLQPVHDSQLKHTEDIKSLAFSPDNRYIASGGGARRTIELYIWDVSQGQIVSKLMSHKEPVYHVFFLNSDSLLSVSTDTTIIWDTKTWEPVKLLDISIGDVAAISPDRTRFICTDEYNFRDPAFYIWDTETWEKLDEKRGHSGKIYALSYGQDNRTFASGALDSTVRLWNAHKIDGEQHKSIGPIESVEFSPDGRLLVTGQQSLARNGNGSIVLWHAETGKLVRVLTDKIGVVHSARFSPNGRFVASDHGVWEIADGKKVHDIRGGNSVAFHPDGHIVATASHDITIWDVNTGEQITIFENKMRMTGVRSIQFSPDGSLLMAGKSTGWIEIWDVKTGEKTHDFMSTEYGDIAAVACNNDGTLLISVANRNSVVIWNVGEWTEFRRFKLRDASPNSVAFHPDGQTFVTGSSDSRLAIWNVHQLREVFIFTADHHITCCAWSPDGRSIAIGGHAGRMHLLRINRALEQRIIDTRLKYQPETG